MFVVTIGSAVEEKARVMMKGGQMMEGYAVDAIGSSAAEACADRVEADIRAAAEADGWKITNRLKPGLLRPGRRTSRKSCSACCPIGRAESG